MQSLVAFSQVQQKVEAASPDAQEARRKQTDTVCFPNGHSAGSMEGQAPARAAQPLVPCSYVKAVIPQQDRSPSPLHDVAPMRSKAGECFKVYLPLNLIQRYNVIFKNIGQLFHITHFNLSFYPFGKVMGKGFLHIQQIGLLQHLKLIMSLTTINNKTMPVPSPELCLNAHVCNQNRILKELYEVLKLCF